MCRILHYTYVPSTGCLKECGGKGNSVIHCKEEKKWLRVGTSELRRQEEIVARDAGLVFIALWGAIIKTKNTDNILNRKGKADAETMPRTCASMVVSFCSHRNSELPTLAWLSIQDYHPELHEKCMSELQSVPSLFTFGGLNFSLVCVSSFAHYHYFSVLLFGWCIMYSSF